jgi:hypothetical protein
MPPYRNIDILIVAIGNKKVDVSQRRPAPPRTLISGITVGKKLVERISGNIIRHVVAQINVLSRR